MPIAKCQPNCGKFPKIEMKFRQEDEIECKTNGNKLIDNILVEKVPNDIYKCDSISYKILVSIVRVCNL